MRAELWEGAGMSPTMHSQLPSALPVGSGLSTRLWQGKNEVVVRAKMLWLQLIGLVLVS